LDPLPSDPQTINFKTVSGITLTGLYYPAATNPAPVVVLMHGSGGHYQDWIANGFVQWLQNRGRKENALYPPVDDPYSFAPMPADHSFAVFAFNNTAGDSIEGAHAAILAAQALPGVDPHRLVTMGGSFGADVATEACTLPGCIGVLGFSPIGSIEHHIYADLVAAMEVEGKVAWCLKAQGDAHGCPPAQGAHFRAIIDPGVAHSLGLLFSKKHAQNWLYTIEFLDCVYEQKCSAQ
jgi:dienelactone hydrolase